ncbi:hypothetical protein F444_02120, partial [Phytophthora nicotianae P1976]
NKFSKTAAETCGNDTAKDSRGNPRRQPHGTHSTTPA